MFKIIVREQVSATAPIKIKMNGRKEHMPYANAEETIAQGIAESCIHTPQAGRISAPECHILTALF